MSHDKSDRRPGRVLVLAALAAAVSLAACQRGPDKAAEEKTNEIIKPVARVEVAAVSAAPAAAAATAALPPERSGEEVVKAQCHKCHETGEMNAPKIGDKQAWAPRISRGLDKVIHSAIHGHGNMPARGGMADLSDAELKSAIIYMFQQSGAPKVEAAPAAAATPAAAEPPPSAPAAAGDGKTVYDQTCTACHAAGVAGAPKLGDKAAWAPRIATGMDALVKAVIGGKNAMPPKGGNAALTDAQVKAAVAYMVDQSK
jgi:cytochrome c5